MTDKNIHKDQQNGCTQICAHYIIFTPVFEPYKKKDKKNYTDEICKGKLMHIAFYKTENKIYTEYTWH